MAGTSLPSISVQGFILDRKSGYLTHSGSNGLTGFNSQRKLAFMRLAETMWPNVTAICKKVGITRNTFTNHYLIDPKFKEEIDLLKEALCDNVEADMVGYAKEPKGFMDRIALLRAYRKELYDPKKVVTIEHRREVNQDEARSRLAGVRNFIDAEIVQPEPPAQTEPPQE